MVHFVIIIMIKSQSVLGFNSHVQILLPSWKFYCRQSMRRLWVIMLMWGSFVASHSPIGLLKAFVIFSEALAYYRVRWFELLHLRLVFQPLLARISWTLPSWLFRSIPGQNMIQLQLLWFHLISWRGLKKIWLCWSFHSTAFVFFLQLWLTFQ